MAFYVLADDHLRAAAFITRWQGRRPLGVHGLANQEGQAHVEAGQVARPGADLPLTAVAVWARRAAGGDDARVAVPGDDTPEAEVTAGAFARPVVLAEVLRPEAVPRIETPARQTAASPASGVVQCRVEGRGDQF